jgi:hypothetical protein
MVYFSLPLIAIGCISKKVRAQERATPRWQFCFTPHLWVSGVGKKTSATNPNVPSQSATASFRDLISHLNSVPITGAFELRYQRFGVLTDLTAISFRRRPRGIGVDRLPGRRVAGAATVYLSCRSTIGAT